VCKIEELTIEKGRNWPMCGKMIGFMEMGMKRDG
jgi:hypothetical protein